MGYSVFMAVCSLSVPTHGRETGAYSPIFYVELFNFVQEVYDMCYAGGSTQIIEL